LPSFPRSGPVEPAREWAKKSRPWGSEVERIFS